jgi:hypothetical protein
MSSILRHVTFGEYSADGSGLTKMKAFCLAVLILLVSGCASVEWTKPGVTPEEFAADNRQCQEDAWRQSTWAYLDRTYPYGGLWAFPDPLGRPMVGYRYSPMGDAFGERYIQETRLADFCMRSKGYELTQVEK